MAIPIKSIASWVLRLGVGGLFVYAGIVKIWDFKAGSSATQTFAMAIQNYQFTTKLTPILLVAVYLPWLELVTGIALLVRKWLSGALLLLGSMTVVFLVAICSAWARGLDISCGCFGKENNATNFPRHIAGDLVLLVAIGLIAWLEKDRGQAAGGEAGPLAGS